MTPEPNQVIAKIKTHGFSTERAIAITITIHGNISIKNPRMISRIDCDRFTSIRHPVSGISRMSCTRIKHVLFKLTGYLILITI